jgi:hypothetical protein
LGEEDNPNALTTFIFSRESTMKNIIAIPLCLALALIACQTNVQAQFTITPGGANSGIGAFQNGAIATSLTGTGQATANLRPGTSTSTPDHLFQSAWWFRGPSDTREFAFGNGSSGSLTVSGSIVGTNDGTLDTGGYDYTASNTAASYSFTSNQRWQIFNPSNTAGTNVQVLASNTITNTGSSNASFSMFFYQDFDIGGTAATDSGSLLSPNYMQIVEGANTADWVGFAANAYRAGAFSGTRLGLQDAVLDNFADEGLPFGPGDFTGAYQWDFALDPGQSITLTSAFTLNGAAIPEPATFGVLGLAALGGLSRRRRA